MSATLKEIPKLDIEIEPLMNSFSKPPDGFELLIEESPDHSLLIDDTGNKLLIQ
jgi:hypothetical protein